LKIDKVVFLLSGAILFFLIGNVMGVLGRFPAPVVRDALRQATQIALPPEYLRPRVYDRAGARWVSETGGTPELVLVTSLWQRDGIETPGLQLMDRRGVVLHEWWADPSEIFPDLLKRRTHGMLDIDIQGAHLFPDGDLLVNLEYIGSVRLDSCSRVEWTVALGNHHSIAPSEQGNSFWIPGVTANEVPRSDAFPDGYPGLDEPLYHDLLLEVSPTGEILAQLNVLDLLYANGLEYHLLRAGPDREDPTHVNDIEPLPSGLAEEYPLFEAGDLVVSLRNPNLVIVVDPNTGIVKWSESDPFLQQHDPDFLGEGWIGVFDNRRDGTLRGSWLGGSRIIAVQPHTDSVRVVFPGPDSEPFYTSVRGKWQTLTNGNTVLVESSAGRVVEVDSLGRTVWEWIAEPRGDHLVPFVSDAVPVELPPEEVAAWPCSLASSLEAGGQQ
jgi:hypothetical protein